MSLHVHVHMLYTITNSKLHVHVHVYSCTYCLIHGALVAKYASLYLSGGLEAKAYISDKSLLLFLLLPAQNLFAVEEHSSLLLEGPLCLMAWKEREGGREGGRKKRDRAREREGR